MSVFADLIAAFVWSVGAAAVHFRRPCGVCVDIRKAVIDLVI